jgi:hypothetical protein
VQNYENSDLTFPTLLPFLRVLSNTRGVTKHSLMSLGPVLLGPLAAPGAVQCVVLDAPHGHSHTLLVGDHWPCTFRTIPVPCCTRVGTVVPLLCSALRGVPKQGC